MCRALTGMLNGATPLTVAAVATLIARRLPGRGTLAGLIIGFGGAVLMALPAMGGSSSAFSVGLIVMALVSCGIALNRAAAATAQRRHPGRVACTGVRVDPYRTARPPAVLDPVVAPSALAMLGLGAGGTAIATILATAAGCGRQSIGLAFRLFRGARLVY
jgi:drug/metabolite transporter (DMT)-like permease